MMEQHRVANDHENTDTRQKTAGEHLFNATTYGGFALVGNEVTATAIINRAEKPGMLKNAFDRCGKLFERVGPAGKLPYVQQRMNYINFAIIGGFLMVPFVKLLEDNKGPAVRLADRMFHGKKVDQDPELQRAYEAMENAPRQSWGSLMKGRLVTVLAAYLVDSTITWKNGFSARALKGTSFEKYSSFEHISDIVADKVSPTVSRVLKQDLAATKRVTSQGFGLLTLSTALTILFYGTSKLFAKRTAHKIEQREERQAQLPAHQTQARDAANDDVPLANDNPMAPSEAARPTAMVEQVMRASTNLAESPEVAHERA